METELKLTVAPTDLGRVRQHRMLADLALGAPKEHRLIDTYYDTSGLDLWQHGLTLRVRAENGAWVQTEGIVLVRRPAAAGRVGRRLGR